MKKFFIILATIILASLIAWGMWFFIFKSDNQSSSELNDVQNFFPVDQSNNSLSDNDQDTTRTNSDEDTDINFVINGEREEIPALRQLSKEPVAGMISFERATTTEDLTEDDDANNNEGTDTNQATTTEIVFRYMERGTGHIYETKENTLVTERISNTTIPKIYNALFSEDGENVILRYLDMNEEDIRTFKTRLVKNTNKTEEDTVFSLEGTFLSNNLLEFKTNGSQENYLYIKKQTFTDTGGLYIKNSDEENETLVYRSPLSDWLTQIVNPKQIAITTKPFSSVYGYSFMIDSETGNINKTLGQIRGLTTLYNKEGTKILYSETNGNSIDFYIRELDSEITLSTKIKTLPEKCAWDTVNENIAYCAVPKGIQRADYPEDWYQGQVSFNDDIWRIDTYTTNAKMIYQNDGENGFFDIIKPQVSPDGRYLLFINKNNLSLWSLDLNPNY